MKKKSIFIMAAIAALGLAIALVLFAVMRGASEAEAKKASERRSKLTAVRFNNAAEEELESYSGKVSRKDLEKAIDEAAQYLVRMCNSEGKFKYRVNIDPNVKVRDSYNMLRHAGTIYSLVDYYNLRKDPKVLDTINRALEFMKKEVIGPVPEKSGMSAVWSPPELDGNKNAPMQAKLGGTGLGLVAAIGTERISPSVMSLEELKRMGSFIVFMQKPDGSFYSKYIPDKGGRDDSWTSLYYPGEAALALAMLYERDGSVEWLNAALRVLAYLAKMREGEDEVEPDHWALISTGLLLKHYDKTDKSVSKETIESHALQIVSYMMKTRPDIPDSSPLYGALLGDGRTTPAATRLEGLLALLDLINRSPSIEPEKVTEAIRGGIAFLVRSQIREGKFKGGIPRAIRREPDAKGDYNERAGEIRIDYVQHALSAMIRYAESPLAD